jgi:hypothetical protein
MTHEKGTQGEVWHQCTDCGKTAVVKRIELPCEKGTEVNVAPVQVLWLDYSGEKT